MKRYFFTSEVEKSMIEVYKTAKGHKEAALKLNKLGIRTDSKKLQAITCIYRIPKPCIKHGGWNKKCEN
jgi:hypothetical protein